MPPFARSRLRPGPPAAAERHGMPIQSSTPVGSKDRLIELGKNPAEWASCSEPDGIKNIGCYQWHRCKWKFGKPKNFGVLMVKPTDSGPVSNRIPMACFTYIQVGPQIRGNGGALKIVAQEGESIRIRGTKSRDPNNPNHISQRALTKDDPEANVVVQPFPDPGERGDFDSARMLAEVRAEMEAESEAEREAALIGVAVEKLTAEESNVAPEATADHEAGRGARGRGKQ